MIKHIVVYRFPSETPSHLVGEVFQLLENASQEVEGMLCFSHGPARANLALSRGFSHCFVMDFDNAKSYQEYLDHQNHLMVRKKVREIVESENDIFEFDYDYINEKSTN